MGEEPGTEDHHGEDDDDRDEEGELTGAAEQGADEVVVSGSVGDRHLGLEGGVDHLDHLEGDAGDSACGSEDDDGDWAERVTDGKEGPLKVESIARWKAHKGDGHWG